MGKLKLELPKDSQVVDGWLIMTSDDLQEHIQMLHDAGLIKPIIKEVSVNKAHLEDMRKIAFAQLDVDHAQGIEAMDRGANLILSALRRSGQITSENIDKEEEPNFVNVDDGIVSDIEDFSAIPEIIRKRGEKLAEQHGLAGIDDILTVKREDDE